MFALDDRWDLYGRVFLVGLLASAFSSADSAMTDLLRQLVLTLLAQRKWRKKRRENQRIARRSCLVLLVVIMIFKSINDEKVLLLHFSLPLTTYGPLQIIFLIFTKRLPEDNIPI